MKLFATYFLFLIFLSVFARIISPVHASYVSQNEGHCSQDSFIKVEGGNKNAVYSADADEGYNISRIFIKAGSSKNGFGCTEYTENKNDGCYVVDGLGTKTANAKKIGDGSSCKDISFVEFVMGEKRSVLTPIPTTAQSSNKQENNNGNNNQGDDSNNNVLGESTANPQLPQTGPSVLLIALSLLFPISLKIRSMAKLK